jgi:predicted O-methyltransferase YrrM
VINRRVVLYLVAVAASATVVLALAGRVDLAIAALAVTVVSMFGWLVLWARALNASVARIDAKVDRQGAQNLEQIGELGAGFGSLNSKLDSTKQYVERRADAHDVTLGRMRRDVANVHASIQRTPSVTTELSRVYQRLVHHDRPMPEIGGWAMTGATLVWVLDQISRGRVSTILECGSGSSTVWFALALEQRGTPGWIVSLESSSEYADETRGRLEELGLAHRAAVLTAPLVDLDMPGRATQPWFDRSVLSDDVTGVDLLFVDGPVADVAPEARYPALPVLADRLSDDALVLLDDASRPDERHITELWCAEAHGGRRYQVLRRLDRSIVFRTVSCEGRSMERPAQAPADLQGRDRLAARPVPGLNDRHGDEATRP